MGKQAHQFEAQFCQGMPPEWEDCILRLHNEREVFSTYPHAALSYFFTEDGWTIDTSWKAPKIKLGKFEQVKALSYPEIPLLTPHEFERLSSTTVNSQEKLAMTKYRFQQTFCLDRLSSLQVLKLWKHFEQHPQQIHNVRLSLLGDQCHTLWNNYSDQYMYSKLQGHMLKMQPLQLNHVLEISKLAGFEGALCLNMGKAIKSSKFKKMLDFCRDLRQSGQLKKIWNL